MIEVPCNACGEMMLREKGRVNYFRSLGRNNFYHKEHVVRRSIIRRSKGEITKMKQCTKCNKLKTLSEFRNDKYATSGKTARCKECLRTFKPKEVRCIYCRGWFLQKQSNYKTCNPTCHRKYWSRVFRLSVKGERYYKAYHRNYSKMRLQREEGANAGTV